jgi:hypothetical protein
MKEKDLIRMFPDRTHNRVRPKPDYSDVPNHPLTTARIILAMMIGLPVSLLLMGLLAYLG